MSLNQSKRIRDFSWGCGRQAFTGSRKQSGGSRLFLISSKELLYTAMAGFSLMRRRSSPLGELFCFGQSRHWLLSWLHVGGRIVFQPSRARGGERGRGGGARPSTSAAGGANAAARLERAGRPNAYRRAGATAAPGHRGGPRPIAHLLWATGDRENFSGADHSPPDPKQVRTVERGGIQCGGYAPGVGARGKPAGEQGAIHDP